MAQGISKNPTDLRAAILEGETSVHKNRVDSRVPKGFLTRRMLAAKTGLSQAELKQLEAHGRLKMAKRDNGGYALYPESVIAELVASAPGNTGHVVAALYSAEQSADIFERLARGQQRTQIVIETKVHPDIFEIIAKKYARLDGAIFITKTTADRIAALSNANFPIDCEEALLEVVETSVKMRRCGKCGRAPSRVCLGCASAKNAASDEDDAPSEAKRTP